MAEPPRLFPSAGEDIEAFVNRAKPSETQASDFCWIQVNSDNSELKDNKRMTDVVVIEGFVAHGKQILEESEKLVLGKECPKSKAAVVAQEKLLELAESFRVTCGKWMLFVYRQNVDEVWSKVALMTASNQLGSSSKVATASPTDRQHLICIYVDNFADLREVKRVWDVLTNMGLVVKSFKPDCYTYLGIYAKNKWDISPVIYSMCSSDPKKDTDFTTLIANSGAGAGAEEAEGSVSKKSKPSPSLLDQLRDEKFSWYGFGTMGLGIVYPEERPSRAEAIRLLHKALDLGVNIFDTADTYCRDETELHYCEFLLAEALSSYKDRVKAGKALVFTKGGMDRKGSDSTGWRPAGGQNQAGGCLTPDQTESRIRASHAALNSCRSLGEQLQPIDLYQLHHPESFGSVHSQNYASVLTRVSELISKGIISAFGLCNCSLECIKVSQTYVKVSSVQNPLSLLERHSLKSYSGDSSLEKPSHRAGVLDYCRDNDIAFLAIRCLGGLQTRDGRLDVCVKWPDLDAVAKTFGETCVTQGLMLSWVRRQAPDTIVTLTGHRKESTLGNVWETVVNNMDFILDENDLALLDSKR